MGNSTVERLLEAFTQCRDMVISIIETLPPGPDRGNVSDYLQLLLVVRNSIRHLGCEERE